MSADYVYECICGKGPESYGFVNSAVEIVSHAKLCRLWNERKSKERRETGIERHWREQEEQEQFQRRTA